MVTKDGTVIETLLELVARYPDKQFDITAEGEILEVSPKRAHSRIQVLFARYLDEYVSSNMGTAYEVLTECAHDLNGWACRPDVSVDAKGAEEIPTVAPLLAVEIKSDANTLKDLRAKARQYLAAGTALVWLVLPDKQVIEVYQPNADDQLLTAADTLTGEQALPGFSVAVAAVFA